MESGVLMAMTFVPCSHYGLLRHELYGDQGYYFCSECNFWDKEVAAGNVLVSYESKRWSAKPSTPLSYRQMRHIRKLWFYMYLETEKEAEELENAK
jgi:hypothetical protein